MASTSFTVPLLEQPIHLNHSINTTLTQDNYLQWKSQVIPVLRGNGLINFIADSPNPPSATITTTDGTVVNPDFSKWQQQDQLILAWMFNSLSPPILAVVIDCETSSQLWAKLKQFDASQSLARLMEIKLKLRTAKKGDASCSEYIQFMKSLADQLRTVGAGISEQDLIFHTFQGLGTEYDNFVTAFSMRRGHISMNELQNLLLAYEAGIQANTPHSQSVSVNAHSPGDETGSFVQSTPSLSSNSPGGESSKSVQALSTQLANAQRFASNPSPFNDFPNSNGGKSHSHGRGRDRSSLQSADGHTDWVSCVCFSPSASASVIVSGSWDRTVRVWNSANCKLLYTLMGHDGYVNAVAVSPDGSICASGGEDGVALLWDLAEGKQVYSFDAGGIIHSLCFSPNRYWLCAATEISVKIWDLESKSVVIDHKPHEPTRKNKMFYCTSLNWSVDGNTICAGYSDGTIRVWGVTGGNYYKH